MPLMEFPAWDPVLIDIPGPLDIRWYGLMYIVAFVVGQFMLVRLARAGFLPVDPGRVADLIFYTVFGTILGGRLGYALFYDRAPFEWGRLYRVWEGGLAFHGGLIGVTIALVLFARKSQAPVGRVCDAAALAVTPGILAVRFANFINGELYGRATSKDTSFAMQFPTDTAAVRPFGLDLLANKREKELAIQHAVGNRSWEDVKDELHPEGGEQALASLQQSLDWERVRQLTDMDGNLLVPYRHPSQLYEGLGEGLLLGLILWAIYYVTRKRPLPNWSIGGFFLLGYGLVRFSLEYVRKPDEQFYAGGGDGTVLFGMTMGQTLSSVMVLIGALLTVRCFVLRSKQGAESPEVAA